MNALRDRIYYSVSDIEREALGYFFSKDTMRFFRSRVLQDVYQGPGGVYFVTSEKACFDDYKRVFTVRKYDPIERLVSTAGDFAQLTKYKAIKAAKQLALGE